MKQKTKMKTKTIVILTALIIATFMVGAVAAMETSFDLVAEGNVFVDEKYRSETHNGLPYAAGAYNHNAFIVGAFDLNYTHSLNIMESIETETSLKYVGSEDKGNAHVFLDESFSNSVIASSVGVDDSTDTGCYSSGAGFSALATYLDFESAAVISDLDVAYAVTATGSGNMQWVNTEYGASGDINGTWITSVSDEDVRTYGAYIFEGSFASEAENFPAELETEERLCPFGTGWD